MLHGYQFYDALKALIENTTEGAIAEGPVQKSEQAVLEFINQFESVAPVEIKTAFDLTDKEMGCLVNPLFNQEKIRKVWAGNGYLIRPARKTVGCDTEPGVCTFKSK